MVLKEGKPWKQTAQMCLAQESSQRFEQHEGRTNSGYGCDLRNPKIERLNNTGRALSVQLQYLWKEKGVSPATAGLTCMLQTWVCKVSGAGFLCVRQRSPGLSWASERGSCGWSWRCRAAGSRPLRPPAQEPPPPPGWWSSPGGTKKRQSRKQQLSDAGVWVLFIS